MMTDGKLLEYVEAIPFRPFRIGMASGSTDEIRHLGMTRVGRTYARVNTIPNGDAGNGVDWHDVSQMPMEVLDPMEPAAIGSGEQPR